MVKEFESAPIACGPVNTIDKTAADPQIEAREMIVNVHHPLGVILRWLIHLLSFRGLLAK